ncbi:MAG: hypothetical protein MJY94_01205 [Bacteroidales bacterium]|nr:hypothetical protein [Bacteroidales bacterium]
MVEYKLSVSIWGFGKPVLDAILVLRQAGIRVPYVKIDYKRKDLHSFIDELSQIGITEVYVEDVPDVPVDMIITINYNRIISEELLANNTIINYHVGLLPKWRGNSANGWGIINGEDGVGYTIHKMLPMLDSGPIYYQYRYPYKEGETYYVARRAIQKDFSSHLPEILYGIQNGEIVGTKQEGDFVYCASFRPRDGYVDWKDTTDTILRKYYVFGPPLGTGLKFIFRGKEYLISRISRVYSFAPSVGIPGSIVFRMGKSLWVKTGDTAVSLDEIKSENEVVDIDSVFMIGQRFE